MLTGILHPTKGSIKIAGLDPIKQRKQVAYKIGCLFGQKSGLWMHLSAFDTYKLFGAIYDLDEDTTLKRINHLIELFDIEDLVHTPVRRLSLGQRMICEIVGVLIHEPEILFLDEPTIGLDPVVKEKIRVFIKRLNKEKHTTIFLTSHDVGDIEKLCKRVIIVNNGEIVLDDSMENLKYHYLNKKIVEAKMNTKINLDDVDGINILKDKDYNLKLEVDLTKKTISDAIKLLDPDKIIDINISNTPLETIISSIYKGTK